MDLSASRLCTAFAGETRIAAGGLRYVASQAKAWIDHGENAPILIFDNLTSEVIEVDFRGSADEVAARFLEPTAQPPAQDPIPEQPRGRGRPKLGVVAREVTLLPRHWEWLRKQPGGASVALRKLVEQARRDNQARDRVRDAQTAVYRFMTTIASHLPEYEEALRALYAGNAKQFQQEIANWPPDIASHIKKLALPAFNAQ